MLDDVATVRRAYAHAAAALSSYRDRDLHDGLENDGGPPLADEDRAVLDGVLDDLQAYLDHMADPANRPPALRPAPPADPPARKRRRRRRSNGTGTVADAMGTVTGPGGYVFQNSPPPPPAVHYIPVPLEPGMTIRYRG